MSQNLANRCMVDIRGIDLHELVRELWNHTLPQGLGYLQYGMPLTDDDIEQVIYKKSIDYLKGRPIKILLDNTDKIDAWAYDRDAGFGMFQKVVDELRKKNTQ